MNAETLKRARCLGLQRIVDLLPEANQRLDRGLLCLRLCRRNPPQALSRSPRVIRGGLQALSPGLDDLTCANSKDSLAGFLVVQELLADQGSVRSVGAEVDLFLNLDLDDSFYGSGGVLGVNRGRRRGEGG